MTTVRCPSCDAAVPADAAWCTLCFAQLRPRAAAPQPPAPEPPALDPLTMPLPAVATAPVLSPPPAATAVVERPADAAPTWPCTSCSQQVPLEEMACPVCGTAFMGGVNPSVSLNVPGVGDLVGMSAGAKFAVMAGGAALLAAALVLVPLALGHIL